MLRYIYISPFSSNWFESTVKDTIDRLAPGNYPFVSRKSRRIMANGALKLTKSGPAKINAASI